MTGGPLPDLPDDLDALDTEELLELLGKVGPVAIERQRAADEAKQARLKLFLVLDGRAVSYSLLGRTATGLSRTAVLKALQRAGAVAKPPIV